MPMPRLGRRIFYLIQQEGDNIKTKEVSYLDTVSNRKPLPFITAVRRRMASDFVENFVNDPMASRF